MYQVQRRSPRVRLNSVVTLVSSEGQVSGILENISLHGALVRTDATLPAGAVAEINIQDPDLPARRTVMAAAIVVRSEKGGIALDLQKMDLDSLILLRGMHSHKMAEA